MTGDEIKKARALCEPSGLPTAQIHPILMETRTALMRALNEVERLQAPKVTADVDETLRTASELFHKILGSLASQRLLAREGKMTQPIRDSLTSKVFTSQEMEGLAADGFEACVRLLAARGAPDVSIHECNPQEHEQ